MDIEKQVKKKHHVQGSVTVRGQKGQVFLKPTTKFWKLRRSKVYNFWRLSLPNSKKQNQHHFLNCWGLTKWWVTCYSGYVLHRCVAVWTMIFVSHPSLWNINRSLWIQVADGMHGEVTIWRGPKYLLRRYDWIHRGLDCFGMFCLSYNTTWDLGIWSISMISVHRIRFFPPRPVTHVRHWSGNCAGRKVQSLPWSPTKKRWVMQDFTTRKLVVWKNPSKKYILHPLGPQNPWKMKVLHPKIWVTNPKNEGCGFPW